MDKAIVAENCKWFRNGKEQMRNSKNLTKIGYEGFGRKVSK